MAKIDTAAMISLRDRLDDLADRIEQEHNTELPAERVSAKGDSELLARLDRRAGDLKVASKMHADAKAAFMAAKAAFKTNPEALETQYAGTLGLAAQIEAVLDYRRKPGDVKDTKIDTTGTADKNSDKGKTDDKSDKPKADDTDGDGKDKGKGDKGGKPADPKSDDKGDGKDKTGGKPDDSTAAILAAIESSRRETASAIAGLEPRLINADLAEIINGLTKEQLVAVLNRRDMSPQAAAVVEALTAFYASPEELYRDLEVLHLAATGGFLERFRYNFKLGFAQGSTNGNTPSTPSGSHR